MRDKNLTLQKFIIQLEKQITSGISRSDRLLRIHVLNSPTRQNDFWESEIIFPRNFRLLRTLAIVQWYLPEELHWKFLIDMKSLSYSWLNDKQWLELAIYLSSKTNCEKYLYHTKRYSGSELFGNILGNDLEDLLENLRIRKGYHQKPKRKVRRRGYQDHGSRRPDHKWLPSSDLSFTIEQNRKERHLELLQRTRTKLLNRLSRL
jgi:hypothetical protein